MPFKVYAAQRTSDPVIQVNIYTYYLQQLSERYYKTGSNLEQEFSI